MSLGARMRLAGWYCLFCSLLLVLLGVFIHFLVLGPRSGWLIHAAVQVGFLAFLAGRLPALRIMARERDSGKPLSGAKRSKGDGADKAPKKSGRSPASEAADQSGESGGPGAASPSCEAGETSMAGQSREAGEPLGASDSLAKPGEAGESLGLCGLLAKSGTHGSSRSPAKTAAASSSSSAADEGDPLFSKRLAWLLLLGAIGLDALHLVSGGRPYSLDSFPGQSPGFYPAVWAAFAAMLGCGSLLAGRGAKLRAVLPPLAVLSSLKLP